MVPPGLSIHSQKLIHYLPGIYQPDPRQQDFMSRFLGIFESILIPIEWNVDNFDLFLNPALAPADFLPWLANWFGVLLQPNWSEAQRRAFLSQAGFLFARRGTSAALQQLLAIFTGVTPEIDDTSQDLPPFTFRVRLPMVEPEGDAGQIAVLIEAHKPAHTNYILEFSGSA
jgi:phage tail-like protein